MKKIGYKAAQTNVKKDAVAGKFKNDGQKPGRKNPAGKEKLADLTPERFMKKVVNDLRKQGKRRQNMMDGTGAFH